jgi:hypothetical protein
MNHRDHEDHGGSLRGVAFLACETYPKAGHSELGEESPRDVMRRRDVSATPAETVGVVLSPEDPSSRCSSG